VTAMTRVIITVTECHTVTALTLVEMLLNTRVWLYAESKLSPLKKISKPPLQKYHNRLIEP